MSLLSQASSWNNSETKKRVPTISNPVSVRNNKTQKKKLTGAGVSLLEDDNDTSTEESDSREYFSNNDNNSNLLLSSSIENTQQENDNRAFRVQKILNQINSVKADDDGQNLANFNPPKYPYVRSAEGDKAPSSVIPLPSFTNTNNGPEKVVSYTLSPKEAALGNPNSNPFSSYREVYTTTPTPYYSKMGISSNNSGSVGGATTDNKLIEKLNYMIHLLEQQQNEPTQHIMEEFILYTFLGIFVIYVVDSFTRGGKYIR